MAAYGLSIGPPGSPSTIIILDIARGRPRLNRRPGGDLRPGRPGPKHNGTIEEAVRMRKLLLLVASVAGIIDDPDLPKDDTPDF